MAQANVAREPSMEEILASIRRIIESNDPAAESASLAAPAQSFAEDDFDDGSGMDFVAELAANDPGRPIASQDAASVAAPALQAVEPVTAAAPERSLSLADVAARVRAASARQQELASQRPTPLRVPELQAAPAEMVAPVQAEQAATREPSAFERADQETAGQDPVSRERVDQEPVRQEPVRQEAVEQAVQAPAMPDLRPSLGHFTQAGPSEPVSRPLSAAAPELPAFTAPASAPSFTTPAAPAALVTTAIPAASTAPAAPAPEAVAAPEPVEMSAVSSAPDALEPEVQAVEPPALQTESQEAPVVEADTPKAAAPDATESPSLPAQVQGMAGLLSDVAGAQVAKSFGELAAVFDGLERKSVEEMAQEMLRPMLQEWLDDNLPTLVERLVREEIERVARGPRR